MEDIKAKLKAKYEMRDLGELHWFLNVKVLRDRRQRNFGSVKVCQNSHGQGPTNPRA